jgi:hypothetical protein
MSHTAKIWRGWHRGELQIHFIHTGAAESILFIFPDGTTMLNDCGDYRAITRWEYAVPIVPGPEHLAGDWIARYVQRVLPENPPEETLRNLAELIYRYDCTGYVCLISREEAVLEQLKSIAPWMILGFEGENYPDFCHKVLLPGEALTKEKADAIHAAGKICMVFADDAGLAEHCFTLGADTVLSRNFHQIQAK